ncbi:MAG: hypothetical protein GKR93_11895 [Gammaproteobacteria bacterium]|nr:hypothetical protein [Gammaproteobacteria bacterium]
MLTKTITVPETTSSHYCPYCQRTIVANNAKEVETGKHSGYVFIHDDIIHPGDFNPNDYVVMH